MKKLVICLMVTTFLVSGCYLVTEENPTPVSSETLAPTSTITDETKTPILVNTEVAASTSTPAFTATLAATITLTPTILPTNSPTPEITATSSPYQLQTGSPVYIKNFAHTDSGCNWMGVAGQVFGEDDSPQINLVVVVKGKISNEMIDLTGVTGVPEADIYGPGGYEIVLADSAVDTEQSLTIQVFDLNGAALSAPVYFDTYSDCEKNLIIINFQPNS